MKSARITPKSILLTFLFISVVITGCDIFDSDSDDSGVSETTLEVATVENPRATSIIRQSDGYVIASTAEKRENDTRFHLLKISENGNSRWQQTFGGNAREEAHELIQLDSGNLLTAGTSSSFNDGGDVYAVQTNAEGNVQWARTFNPVMEGLIYNESAAYTAIETASGNILIGGSSVGFQSGSGAFLSFLMMIDSNGNVLWTNVYDIQYEIRAVAETQDNGFVFTGRLEDDIAIVKTDNAGNITWQKQIQVGEGKEFNNIIAADDGILVGGIQPFSNTDHIRLIKTGPEGQLRWTQLYEGKGVSRLHTMVQHPEGGFVLAGFTVDPKSEKADRYLAHIDDRGALTWERIGNSERSEQINDVIVEGNRLVQIVTSTGANGQKELRLVKTDLNGN